MSGFTFNGDYDDEEQVAEFLPDFERAYAAVVARDGYPYNDSFRGRIPGIAGPGEDAAIYLLQGLKRSRGQAARVAELLGQGYEPLTALDDRIKARHVVLYPTSRVGGSWAEYADARIVPKGGRPHAILPKGAVTRGYRIGGRSVLVLR